MKRSAKLFQQARREALLAVMFSVICATGCVWSARVGLSAPAGGLAAFVLTLAALFPAAAHAKECARLLDKAKCEERYEYERSIRY